MPPSKKTETDSDSWIKYLFSWLREASGEKNDSMRKKTARKEKFILRPDLMSPIRKTSLLYVRVIFIRAICCSLLVETVFFVVYMKRVPELISPRKKKKEKSNVDCVALRLARSHSLPRFRRHDFKLFNKQSVYVTSFVLSTNFSADYDRESEMGREPRGWHNIDQSADDVRTTRWFSAESRQLFARAAIKLQSDLICSHLSLQKFAFRTQERHSKKI